MTADFEQPPIEMQEVHRERSLSVEKSGQVSRTAADKRNYLVGVCLLLFVVVLWTSSNFLTQDLFEAGFEKPFLVTYLNTSSFALYLVPFLIRRWRGTESTVSRDESRGQYEALPASDGEPVPSATEHSTAKEEELPPLTTRETAKLASGFCFLWIIANWTVNASLDYTSVASSTILSSMSGFFTLVLGRLFRVELFTLSKFAAVVTSFVGVLLVSLSDSSTSQQHSPSSSPLPKVQGSPHRQPNAVLGDGLALISAIFYALYVTFLKVRIRDESRINMQLFFGFVGLFNILSCWPISLVLHFTGVERFELPSGGMEWAVVATNMAITLSSDYIYVLAMLKTTPLVVTIGLSLTIPLAIVGDWFLGKKAQLQALFGAALVLLSFLVVGVEDSGNQPVSQTDAVIVVEEDEEQERGRSRTETPLMSSSS